MDVNTIQSLVSELGFPILVALMLSWFIWKLWLSQQEQNQMRENKLYSFIEKATQINEDLSRTNQEFLNVLNTYRNDLDDIKKDVGLIKEKLN